MELQQSSLYRAYIQKLGWSILTVDDVAIFYRTLPLIGTMAKIQRPGQLPYIPHLIIELQKLKATTLVLEAAADTNPTEWERWTTSLSKFFRIITSPYLPSKTIVIDIHNDEQILFKHLTEAKQRAIRKAKKNGVSVSLSDTISDLIKIKSTAAGLFGEITTYGLRELSETFGSPQTVSLLASIETPAHGKKIVGGVFMIFDGIDAYYWIAGATKEGKKLFVPTLLVWEAIIEAKKRGCTRFDFVGVWDERMPKQNKEWLGFTKFKEGFGGTSIYYPIHRFLKR
jgi:lipid II:glycine glycyltransferase (peptidoglycan interpeptide bridge formation enzyme)